MLYQSVSKQERVGCSPHYHAEDTAFMRRARSLHLILTVTNLTHRFYKTSSHFRRPGLTGFTSFAATQAREIYFEGRCGCLRPRCFLFAKETTGIHKFEGNIQKDVLLIGFCTSEVVDEINFRNFSC